MTYEYSYTDEAGGTFEVQQRITDPALKEHEGRPCRRLISSQSGGFRLVSGASGGWSRTGYSPSPNQRWAEKQLGRKLIKPGGEK